MALEVGRLVARIDIEGSFEQKLAAVKAGMEDTARSATKLDESIGKAGKSGSKLDVPTKAKDSLDKTAASASKASDNISKAGDAGKKLDVSDAPKKKLEEAATSAGKASSSMQRASDTGKKMNVSDQPRQKLAETASFADQLDAKLGHVGLSLAKLKTAGTGLAIGATLFAGLDRVKAIDTAQGKLRGLGHEAASVTEIMNSATESVTGTAYGLGDAATIAANAVAAGIKPGKDLTKYLTMTADASAIAGVSLGEMGRILNQVQTGQSAYAGDLSQLADRGIPIYQWLADEAGVAATEVKKMASTGQISSQMLFSAIQNNIGGAAQEMGGTLVGSIANVGAAFGRLGAAAIDPFKDDIMGAAEGAQEFAGALSGVVGPAASVAASALSTVADVIGIIPTPILAATAGLVALQKTGLGASMAGAASTAVGALRGVGETMALGAMYAGDNIRANGLFAASMDGIRGAAGGMRRGLSSIVDMLGGPLMIGLAGATVAVTDIIGSIKRASEAQSAISESAGRAASAHRDLAAAIGEANGAITEQTAALENSIIEESITSTGAAAEQASGMLAGLGNWIDQTTIGYDGMKNAIDGNVSALDRSRLEGRVSEMQMAALEEATSSLGIEMDDVADIVRRGGPEWHNLRAAMAQVGPEGEDMANKMQAAADAAEATREAAQKAEPGAIALSEAFKLMGDEAATAAEKAEALDAALVALAGPTYDADEAMGNYWETMEKTREEIAGLVGDAENLTSVTEDGTLGFNMQSEASRNLRDMFIDMRRATVDAVVSGGDMGAVTEENAARMRELSEQTGLTIPELEQLAEKAGFFKDPIELAMNMVGGDEVAAEIAMVSTVLDGVPEGKTINVGAISDRAIEVLRALEYDVEKLPDGTVEVTAKTEDAREGLQNLVNLANTADGLHPTVNADTNAKLVSDDIMGIIGATNLVDQAAPPSADVDSNAGDVNNALMGLLPAMDQVDQKTATPIITADTAAANSRIGEIFRELSELDMQRPEPEVDLLIDQFMQGRDISHAELDALHSRVVDPQARLLIEQLLAESARANADLDNTARPRTATITPQLAAGSLGSIQAALNSMSFTVPVTGLPSLPGAADGGIFSFADGGTHGVRSFANGGRATPLPSSAKIERAHGPLGLIQWAEQETQGEAFIPLAPSKRRRSRQIWAETGRLLGVNLGNLGEIASFANGGFHASKALTGTPYIWGGFSPAGVDCSGLMSVAANEATGRPAYSERTSTHTMGSFLAARGFVRGMGGAGDLRIGWNQGHTAGTAPDGTKFESQTYGRGAVWGGDSRGHDLADFNQHMHLPMSEDAGEGLAGDDGKPYVDNRTPRQKNIDAIVSEGQRRGLSDRDIQIALMTAEQESGIRVLANPADAASMNMPNEGVGYDHDSTGIFQQRNNGAWGTLEDRMDPTKSAGMFYDELEKIEGRDSMALTQVAQKVQRSAYPDAYAKHEGKASEELAASKARLESLSKTGGGSGEGQKVFVTNWPSGGGSYTRSSSASSDAIGDAKDAVEDAQKAAFIQDQSIAAMLARSAGRSDLIQVEKFADGGFHGLENHTAHIAPAGSYRLFGEPETGGEAYIPLASHKRARSTAILAETARRMGYSLGAGVNLVGSVLTGNGLDTGWGGPSLSDLGIDTGALRDSLSPGVTAEAEKAGMQIAAILQELGQSVDQQVEGTLRQSNDGANHLRQQYARALI